MILQVKNLSKSFGIDEIFSQVNFQLNAGDKAGLVGPNGAGKSTLLRCIIGEEEPDSGEVMTGEGLSMGYLQQIPEFPQGTTLFDAVMEMFADLLDLRVKLKELEYKMGRAKSSELERMMESYSKLTEEYERSGGFSCEATVRKVTVGLGFKETDLTREVNRFSGGEKTRAGLARLLVREPDLLLLDEPTNHLDLEAVEWLEGFLKGYKGSLLLISHDRYFLDQVTNKTLELEHGELAQYPGNYSRYLKLKEERILAQTRAYVRQHKEIKATQEYINKYRAGIKAKQARGRQSQLDRMERLAAPKTGPAIHVGGSVQNVDLSGKVVLVVNGLTMGFPERQLFTAVNLQINQGEKVALIGPNGIGKSSLLKAIVGQQQPLAGHISLGARVKLGYYDQEHAGLDQDKSVLDELLYNFDLTIGEARDYLAAFLFRGDDVFKSVRELSGGEKGRLSFLKLILARPNFLILDEPTNHLDIPSKQVVENYLRQYSGTVLTVSHDRYFLDKTVERILELATSGLTEYLGNYSDYKERKAQRLRKLGSEESLVKPQARTGPPTGPKVSKAKTREQIARLEQEIEEMEDRINNLSQLLADAATYQDEEKAKELVGEYKLLEEKISQTYVQWEQLNELLANG